MLIFLLDTVHMVAMTGLVFALAAMAWARLAPPVAAALIRLRRRLRRRG